MNKDPENLLEPEDKVIFLSDVAGQGRKAPMPLLMILAILVALITIFWKTAVRQPENRKQAVESVINRTKAEEKLIEERVKKQREEYLRKYPNKHKEL